MSILKSILRLSEAIPELPVHNWWFFGVVLFLLIIFIWVIARLTAAMTDHSDPAEIDRQMLSAVRDLHSQGELSSEEFRSIKSRLVQRMSDENRATDSDDSALKGTHREDCDGNNSQTAEIITSEGTGSSTSTSEDPASENAPHVAGTDQDRSGSTGMN
ncbi:MAG: hypothetical protein KDA81_18470 [Planctomycetaceae bacterium]|nr:hypothetical protein [Planctomycetaceae bacterium]